jgi:hypothetical protein
MKVDISYRANLLTLYRALSFVGLLIGLPACFWSLLESWQRPIYLLRIDERLLLGAGIGGILLAIFAWPEGWRVATWQRRAFAAALGLAAFFTGGHLVVRENATRDLLRHPTVLQAMGIEVPEPSGSDSWIDSTLEWLDDHGVPVPRRNILEQSQPYSIHEEPIWHLLESSRWPVRFEFMQRLMRNEKGTNFLLNDWNTLFPAITGQDVKLKRRTAMLERLEILSNDTAVDATLRDTAIFWQSLIVISDPKSFADERTPIVHRMLANENPPTFRTGDVWMRALGMLLVHDPTDQQISHLGRLAHDPTLLRRALRERIRGIEGHVPALLQDLENEESYGAHQSAMAIWLDLKHLADRLPESPARTTLQDQLRTILTAWLIEEPSILKSRFINHGGPTSISVVDVMMEMPEDTRAKLDAHAHALLENPSNASTAKEPSHDLRGKIEQALIIRNFLDDPRRERLSNKLADWMIDWLWDFPVPSEQSSSRRFVICGHAAIWEDLTADLQTRIGQIIRSHLGEQDGLNASHQHRIIIGILGASRFIHDFIKLDEAEWLMLATHRSPSWYWPYEMQCWWMTQRSFPRHFFSKEAVEIVIRAYENITKKSLDSIRLSTKNDAFVFEKFVFAKVLKRAREAGASRDRFLGLFASMGFAAVEDFPEDLPTLLALYPELLAQLLYDPSQARLLHWLDEPQSIRMILDLHQPARYWFLRNLPNYLATNRPTDAVLNEIVAYYHELLTHRKRSMRIEAHRDLFLMHSMMATLGRDSARQWFFNFMMTDRPATTEMTLHVPWADDALSATFSWHSQILGQVDIAYYAQERQRQTGNSDEVFTMLFSACDVNTEVMSGWYDYPYPITIPVPKSAWLSEPPNLPLSPTPWQRARDLSKRRPDLHFPDRMVYRPSSRAYKN